MLPSKEERERARRAAQNSKPYKSAQEKWWEEHQKKETAEREKREKDAEDRKRAAAENARKKAAEREAEVMSNPKLNDAQKAEFSRLETAEKDKFYAKLRVMAESTFTPISSSWELPGRLAHGAPPASSQVYAAPQQLQSTDEFEDDDDDTSGGWGRISPEYRNYTYLKVTLAPDGVATLDLDDGVYCNPATGYEFRGTMPYRVTEGAVVFYVDGIELAAADKWKLPRGPGGKRVDSEPHKLIPDERTPAALFEDAWNGLRESRKCNFESSYKLKDVLWPAAALVELKSAAVVELS